MRHVKTSEAYQLNEKRKFFVFCINQSIFTSTLNAARIICEMNINLWKIITSKLQNRLTNIYNSVVLIPILQLFTIYCNRKQIHYLFFFLVSAFKCQIIPPGENVLKVATVIFPF